MELKHQVETFITVDYHDLEQYIYNHYQRLYNIVAGEEGRNDTQMKYTVVSEPLDEYDAEDVERFKSGKRVCFILRTILIDLCNNGKIIPGTYLIQISW